MGQACKSHAAHVEVRENCGSLLPVVGLVAAVHLKLFRPLLLSIANQTVQGTGCTPSLSL